MQPDYAPARVTADFPQAAAPIVPRDPRGATEEALSVVTSDPDTAAECVYCVPRAGETVEGPSARFAELIAQAWGNCRIGARVVEISDEYVTAQGVYHDLEKNVLITQEIQRRITKRDGKRFSEDMIQTTANAACSIALRNAILRGIPKPFWMPAFEAARSLALGKAETLEQRRDAALKHFAGLGVPADRVLAHLGVNSKDEITLRHLALLKGIAAAANTGEVSLEELFNGGVENGEA